MMGRMQLHANIASRTSIGFRDWLKMTKAHARISATFGWELPKSSVQGYRWVTPYQVLAC